jgi:hypothetical protein
MLDLVQAAARLQQRLDGLRLPNCLIGGLALQAWGEVRVTRDADFTVLTRFVDEETKLAAIMSLLTPRRPDALQFALRNRVLLGYVEGDISVDIGIGGFDYEENVVRRAVRFELAPNIWARICTAEDLIVMKAFAGRDQDWTDIRGVIARQVALDWNQIELELRPLLELAEAPERMELLLEMRAQRS